MLTKIIARGQRGKAGGGGETNDLQGKRKTLRKERKTEFSL